MSKAEELAAAMQSGIVTDRNFRHAESGSIEFPRHFDADHAACGFQRNDVEDFSAHQAEITIHITDRKSKNESHRAAIQRPDPNTVPAVSYTHLRAHETPEHLVCRLLLEK